MTPEQQAAIREAMRAALFDMCRGVCRSLPCACADAAIAAHLKALEAAGIVPLEDRIDKLEEALRRIVQWADAYPLDIFPEPDFARAAHLLRDGGITLDSISASILRRAVAGVGKIAREALDEQIAARPR